MDSLSHCMGWQWVARVSWVNFLSESLISENLFLFENFLSKAYLNFDNSLLIYYPVFRSAIVNEKFLVINFDSLTSFNVAHKATEKEGMKICLFNVFESLLFSSVSLLILSVIRPYRRNSYYLNCFRSWWIYLNISWVQINFSEKWSWIFDVKFIVIEL